MSALHPFASDPEARYDPKMNSEMDSPQPDRVRVNIVFDPALASEVTEELAASGLDVEAEFGVLGVISGRAAEEALDILRSVEGVLAVEPDRAVDIQAEPEDDS